MKKTKLLTSLAAFVLVIGLGACELPEQTSSEETGVTTETDTTVETDTTDTDTTPKETNPDGYVLVGDFIDSNWDSKVSEDSKYYIPLGTTEYKQTVTIAAEPDYGSYEPWDAGLRVVEWGDSWNLVVGSDELDEDSTGVTGNDASKNIKVKWGETYDITIAFGETNSILVTLQTKEGGEEGGNDDDSDTVSFSGKFDFTTNGVGEELASTAMSSATDLDGFWTGDDLYVCCREYGSIWLGNKENGAFQSNGLIKVGASGGQGVLNFKFAVGVNIEKVVVSAHSWTTNEANNLTINGETLAMPQSGSFEELTYEFEDEYQNILSFNCTSRGFVQYIEVYGTYTDSVEPITALTLIADKTELNEGETTEITISYEPVTGFDIDTLAWTSDNEDVVIVSQTLTGANATALAEGEAKITAQAPNGVEGIVEISVSAIEVGIGESVSTTITYETIMNHPTYAGTNWNSSGQTVISSTDGKVTDFTGFKVTWYTGTESGSSSNGCSIYGGTSLRIYKYSHFDIEALTDYVITSTEVYTSQNGSSLTCTNGADANWANYTWTTGGPADGTNPIVYKNTNSSSTTITIGYITVVATRIA